MDHLATWTIVTPSIGRKSLLHLKEQLKKEEVSYIHLVMMDSKKDPDAVPLKKIEDDVTFVYDIKHPLYPQPKARMDVYLRAIGISMARTPYIRCCDDDVWPEEKHLSIVTHFMQNEELDFCWCLRNMYTRDKQLIGVDRFEAIGIKNKFGYNLLDNSSLFYNQKVARHLSNIFLDNPVYGDDRLTWDPLNKYFKGKFLDKVLTNHMAQPHLTNFFKDNCSKN